MRAAPDNLKALIERAKVFVDKRTEVALVRLTKCPARSVSSSAMRVGYVVPAKLGRPDNPDPDAGVPIRTGWHARFYPAPPITNKRPAQLEFRPS